jgi:hypothetical protein
LPDNTNATTRLHSCSGLKMGGDIHTREYPRNTAKMPVPALKIRQN